MGTAFFCIGLNAIYNHDVIIRIAYLQVFVLGQRLNRQFLLMSHVSLIIVF